jgi:hypothetical protein
MWYELPKSNMHLAVIGDNKPYFYLLDVLIAYGIQKVVVL